MAKRKPIVIELFVKKTDEKKRTIRFKTPSEFKYFLRSFKNMRYPGYYWKYRKKRGK